jgi:hypothetical protein
MSRAAGSSLMFDEESIRSTTEHLPRLIRIIFYAFGITNEGYLRRYYQYFQDLYPEKSFKEFNQQATSHRKVLLESKRKLTFNMLRTTLNAMGYDIDSVQVHVTNKLNGEKRVFSTEDTVETINEVLKKEKVVGVTSII